MPREIAKCVALANVPRTFSLQRHGTLWEWTWIAMYYIYIWYIYIYIWCIHIYIYIYIWYTTVGNDHPCVFLVFRCEKQVVDLFNMYLTCLNSKQGCQQQEMRIEVAEEMGIWPARHGSNQHSGVYVYIYILWLCGTSKWWHAQTCKNVRSVWYFVVGLFWGAE